MKYLANLDLNQNELQNAKIQNLATAPETPVQGQLYFNTTTNKYIGYNGSKWIELGYEHPSNHNISDILGLQLALDGKASTDHNHNSIYKSINYVPNWLEITGVPSTFTPSSHNHNEYINQNAFANIKIGSNTIVADNVTDTLELIAGSNITLSSDETNDRIMITANVPAHPSGEHVTNEEKEAWNAKETTTGSQAKATKALADAKSYADNKVASLVGSAPEALDTLQELAAAVQGNQAGVTDLLEQVGTKASTSYVNSELSKKSNTDHTHNNYALINHSQASNTITSMAGYAKPGSTSAIGTSDTLNIAIGKLEKALDGKQSSGSYEPAFSKNTAFNKNFGTSSGTVAEGNHTHSEYAASGHNHNGVYIKKHAQYIGDNSNNIIKVTHNLGSTDVTVSVKEVSTNQIVFTDVSIVDSNNISIAFSLAPASNAYRVVVTG